MKVNLSFLLLLCITVIKAQSSVYHLPTNKTDVAENDLKGNVKSVIINEWEIVVKFGDPVKELRTFKEEIFFKKDGLIDKSSYEYEKGEGKRTRSYTYNTKNKIVEIKKIYSEKNKVEIVEYLYNAKNQLIEINFYADRNRLYGKDKYSYDENGLASIIKYNGEGKYNGKQTYKWNHQSRMITENTFNYKEEPVNLFDFKYDEKGNVISQIETTKYSGYSMPMSQTEFTYNSKNLLIKKFKNLEYSNDSYEVFFTYDSYGNVIK